MDSISTEWQTKIRSMTVIHYIRLNLVLHSMNTYAKYTFYKTPRQIISNVWIDRQKFNVYIIL